MVKKQDETIQKAQTALGATERELALEKQQNEINKQLIALEKREAEVYKNAFEREQEITDRAMKLVEASKPKANWSVLGILGVLALFIGHVL